MIRWPAYLLSLAALAGCGGGGGESSGQREEVEALIRSQFPASVQRNTGKPVLVNEIGCVEQDENRYECIASVTGTDGVGGLQEFDVPVTATCDDRKCVWRTTG